ncbi:hypothetical protein BSQ39_07140 [Loigolactobacillus backii]|uniref:alpha/beta fold hydrolase n=1 Tax=Loigolactobacillus backii TaxID=375175 RepID=UPI000C1CAE46|nr:alpha/beta hydrolase [Loigolactobacillus backii]PIO83343.1 hypothetical protein BSQ39_07140 [Loigolactobacillus backii]
MKVTFTNRRNIRQAHQQQLAQHSSTGYYFNDYVSLNGLKQWVTIRGAERTNPLLLIIHGGPAATNSMFSNLTQNFEKEVTIVEWDQRGAGKTYRKQKVTPTSLQEIVDDGLALTRWLRKKFSTTPLILVGSSEGSFTANLMLQQSPQYYAAYIATDQDFENSRQAAVDQLKALGQTNHNKKMIHRMKKMPQRLDNWTDTEINHFNRYAAKANPAVPNAMQDLLIPQLLTSPFHSLTDVMAFFRGMRATKQQLAMELDHFNYERLLTETTVPFFIFQGAGDVVTPAASAKDYFDQVKAPSKKMVLIPDSGHLCLFANPDYFLKMIRENVLPVLN